MDLTSKTCQKYVLICSINPQKNLHRLIFDASKEIQRFLRPYFFSHNMYISCLKVSSQSDRFQPKFWPCVDMILKQAYVQSLQINASLHMTTYDR